MSATSQAILLGIFTLASSIWIGGYVAIAVVARVATRTLEPQQRVRLFRGLGRFYLLVGTPALIIALGTGAGLVGDHAWDGTVLTTVVIAAALLVSLVVGVVQARRMTRLRAAAVIAPEDPQLTGRVREGARVAAVLRAAIGLLSLTLIALGTLLAT
jgi:uncharacterized membrane protein